MSRPSPQDWLLDRMLKTSEANEQKTVWLISAFVLLSFVSISLNLGAIESAEMNLLFFKSSLESNWPIRLLMLIGVMLVFLMNLYFFLEAQKSIKAIEYLAGEEHDRALEVGKLGLWYLNNCPGLLKQQLGIIQILMLLAIVILLIVWGSFLYSIFL